MSEQIFLALSIVIWAVLITLGIMKALKQPMIIWYILAGTLISIFLPSLLHGNTSFESFGNLGISFLLFMVGMELNPNIIKDLWKTALIAGTIQVLVTSFIWWWVAMLLGMDPMTSLYIWVWFSFSSTIVVLKLLGDKEEMESTFGRLSIWILVVQDLIVMLLLLWLATFRNIGDASGAMVIWGLLLKMIVLWTWLYFAGKYLIPKITQKIAESQEYLFLFAIGRCFILGSIFHFFGFGIEIWTLIAGITLANSSYRFEIISRIKSLKDFFIVIFFVLLWSHIDFAWIWIYLPKVILLSLFVLIGKPIIINIILWLMWHTKKNNLFTGMALWQISEFSFLLITMGITSWVIKDPNILGIVTFVWLLSIAWSSYFIVYSEKLYHILKPILKFLPGLWNREYKKINKQNYDIILLWFGRFGSNLYQFLSQRKEKILVIDEHPWIIKHLQEKNIACVYWDVWDSEFLQELNTKETKMIISTVKNFDENIVLLKTMKNNNKNLIIILVSNHVEEALKLYEQWADYVILPHYIWVDHTSLMLEEYGFDIKKFINNKKYQLHKLQEKQEISMIEALSK